MSDTITIALNKLAPWNGNVRRTGVTDGIAELAASIASHGLLQSLVVRETKRGKYEIIAGQRRYLALKMLVRDRTIAKDYPVPCITADDAVDASELSLTENIVRAPMHPADQLRRSRPSSMRVLQLPRSPRGSASANSLSPNASSLAG